MLYAYGYSLPLHHVIADDLLRIAKGEVLGDSWSRQAYSVDASHYEIQPAAAICPVDSHDVEQACKYSSEKKVPITARGAGTGLLGQSLSEGIILDFTKHMNRIIEIEDDYVVVQPGIVKGVLDRELKKRNKFLPPDPASSNYCTIGGMIADNSSGMHCLGYGNTIDFLEGVDVVYADGEPGFASADRFDGRMEKLGKLLSPHADAIKNGYPKVSKNSCGYRLDTVMSDRFMPHKVFAASEGTLGIVTCAKLRLLDIPEYRCIMVLGFVDLLGAVSAVPAILKFSPVALEMLDHTVLSFGSRAGGTGCLLFVEFAGDDSKKIEDRLQACKEELAGKCSVLEYASDEQSMAKIWRARKGALNNVMKLTVGSRKPIGLIEDTVVRPELLADHATNLLQTYRQNKLDYVMYGHVGDGNIHTRPLVDMGSDKEVDLMRRIAKSVFEQVIRSGGTITGEHGDGLARVSYIEMMYGRHITDLFSAVKKLLDPAFMMNPGKKVPVQ
ncbi:FAD-binding oxidoreductase [Candidatus Nitrososphaera gargensis]|uniref:FAD-binding oxidoreductase n=1 Tax=Candidatus Nitrososphaera gargensis TaxID=497727 RepID=UPI0011E5297D|nr:FAD-binding oxidoreductase [Candidatus Nitrososphaera gargensis]